MTQSATMLSRSARREATASRLSSIARRLTAAHGLSGFTIEEVCAEAGVSRRTFFNYFPSKDEAVLGVVETDDARLLEQSFMERPARGWPAVLDDLVDLAIEHITSTGVTIAAHTEFLAAIEREPRLLSRVMGITREREQALFRLIAAREGTEPDDLHVQSAVLLFSTMLRSTVDRVLAGHGSEDMVTLLRDSLTAVRQVASPPSSRKDHP